MQKDKALILLGIKHSGKSTQGKLLAEHFNCPFIDVDDAITKAFKKTPREIYTEKGPAGFMYAEEMVCKKIAEDCKNKLIIVSTGGGIGDNSPALTYLSSIGDFLYIDVNEQTACNRILKKAVQAEDGTWQNLPAYIAKKNPKTEKQIRDIFHDFYEERTAVYKAIADYRAVTNEASKEQNLQLILGALGI